MSERVLGVEYDFAASHVVELLSGETVDLADIPLTGPRSGYPEPCGEVVFAGIDRTCGMDVNVTIEEDASYLKQAAA